MIYSDLFYSNLEKENSDDFVEEKTKYYNNIILPFYKNKGDSLQFIGQADIPISCRFFRHSNPIAKVVLLTGYNESYLKYAEFIRDLYNLNVSVYCYDHRGQGFSGALPNQNNRGFIDSFTYLVEDLTSVFNMALEDQNKNTPIYLISHSMGGAIAAQALCEKKINPVHALLNAPMFEVSLTPWSILELPIYFLAKCIAFFGKDKVYGFGQGDCIPFLDFNTNDVTHSKYRFFIWRKHISEIEKLQLGGVTFGWLIQSIQASRKIRIRGEDNSIPVTILQAEEDTIVAKRGQDLFVKSCLNAKLVVMGHAKHEIFMEIDFIRNKALDIIKNMIVR